MRLGGGRVLTGLGARYGRLRLRTKMLLLVGLPMSSLVLTSWAVATWQDVAHGKQALVGHAEAFVQAIQQDVERIARLDDRAAGVELVERVQSFQEFRELWAFDLAGNVLFAHQLPGRPPVQAPAPGVARHAFESHSLHVFAPLRSSAGTFGTAYVHVSTLELTQQLERSVLVTSAALLATLLLAAGIAIQLQSTVTRPLLELGRASQRVMTDNDYCVRVTSRYKDEVGDVCSAFNAMLDHIQEAHVQLEEARDELEARVIERTSELAEANADLEREVAERERMQAERERLNRQLVDMARKVGMSDFATGVLHDVGNALTSVNVSVGLIVERSRKSPVGLLSKVSALLGEGTPEGTEKATTYLRRITSAVEAEQATLASNVGRLERDTAHVTRLVAMQQSHAKVGGLVETFSLSELLDELAEMYASELARLDVSTCRDYQDLPPVRTDRAQVLRILVNCLNNARDALLPCDRTDKTITLRLGPGADGLVALEIADNGIGISAEHLERIFRHGFSLKEGGHGFGLHASANAARQLGGSLVAHSDGLGTGATFRLLLPAVELAAVP